MKKREIFCINPNCLAIFPENKALFVCYSSEDHAEYKCEKSNARGHFEHSSNYLVFEGFSQLPWYMKILGINSLSPCPKCGRVTYQRACPKCHSELIGETEKGFETSNFICMVGAPSSGKTAWFYSLKHHLAEFARQTKIQCIPYTTITNAWLGNMNEIFQEEGKLPATKDLKDKARPGFRDLFGIYGGKFSLVYRITTPSSEEPVYLISPDPEGEIYIHPDKEKQCLLLLSRAEAIFYFINPLSIPRVKSRLDISEGPGLIEQDLILARICQLLSQISHTKRKILPIAVIITHTDILFNLLRNDYQLDIFDYGSEPYTGSYSSEIYNKISEMCKEFLEKVGLGSFVTMVETEFEKHSFFFTAANNEDPRVVKDRKPPYSIQPFRVMDPLVWILWIYKYIPGD